jgi:hypothetical protein
MATPLTAEGAAFASALVGPRSTLYIRWPVHTSLLSHVPHAHAHAIARELPHVCGRTRDLKTSTTSLTSCDQLLHRNTQVHPDWDYRGGRSSRFLPIRLPLCCSPWKGRACFMPNAGNGRGQICAVLWRQAQQGTESVARPNNRANHNMAFQCSALKYYGSTVVAPLRDNCFVFVVILSSVR